MTRGARRKQETLPPSNWKTTTENHNFLINWFRVELELVKTKCAGVLNGHGRRQNAQNHEVTPWPCVSTVFLPRAPRNNVAHQPSTLIRCVAAVLTEPASQTDVTRTFGKPNAVVLAYIWEIVVMCVGKLFHAPGPWTNFNMLMWSPPCAYTSTSAA